MNLEQIGQLVQDVHDGNENPLKAYGVLKDIENYVKTCIKEVNDVALMEAQKFDKTFEDAGYKFERRNGATRWNFDNVLEVQEAKAKVKMLEAKYKSAYKSKTNGVEVFDHETGELMQLPTVTYSKDSLIFKGFVK